MGSAARVSRGPQLCGDDPALSSESGILGTLPLPAPDVSEPQSGRPPRGGHPAAPQDRRTLFERLVEFISPGPDSKDELIETLADAEQRELIEPQSRAMLEGVLRMADMAAGDVMVAAPRMDVLDIDWPYDVLLAQVIDTGHARFPVTEGARDNIIGILLLEDLLKEIVGELEDEFDDADAESGVYTLADGSLRVAGDADIRAVNEAFSVQLPEEDFDTIGGLLAHETGHVPRRGESVRLGGLDFSVMLTRGGAVRWFKVRRLPAEPGADDR